MINEEKKKTYGFAYLDGVKEKLGIFTVEQAAIPGRGDNPLRGKVKKQVNPEDVTINIGENDQFQNHLQDINGELLFMITIVFG